MGVFKKQPERPVWLKWSDSEHGGREVMEVSRTKMSQKPTFKEGHMSIAIHGGVA